MATKTGYLGPTESTIWGTTFIAPLQANTTGRLILSSGDIWGLSNGIGFQMDSDEYPTTIALSGYTNGAGWANNHNEYATTVTLYLCTLSGSTRANQQSLWSFNVEHSSSLQPTYSAKTLSSPTNYQNKTLYIYASQNIARFYSANSGYATFTFNTTYVPGTITVNSNSGGTVTLSSNSLSRGQTATITTNCNAGFSVLNITATGGTITQNSSTTYTFTMSTPAQNATIDVTFGRANQPVEVTRYAIITAEVGQTYYG